MYFRDGVYVSGGWGWGLNAVTHRAIPLFPLAFPPTTERPCDPHRNTTTGKRRAVAHAAGFSRLRSSPRSNRSAAQVCLFLTASEDAGGCWGMLRSDWIYTQPGCGFREYEGMSSPGQQYLSVINTGGHFHSPCETAKGLVTSQTAVFNRKHNTSWHTP